MKAHHYEKRAQHSAQQVPPPPMNIELFYYDFRTEIWLSILGLIVFLVLLMVRHALRIRHKADAEAELLKIKRPQSPIEAFLTKRKDEITLLAPTVEERTQLMGELKGSVTAITAFADEDAATLPLPLDQALKDLTAGRTASAETILRDKLIQGRQQVAEGGGADKARLEAVRERTARAARNLAAFVMLRDQNEAAELYAEAADLMPGEASLWRRLGDVRYQRNQLEAASKAYGQAAEIADNKNEKHTLAAALVGQGRVARRKRQNKKAREFLERALNLAEELSRRDLLGMSHRELGQIELRAKNFDAAKERFDLAIPMDRMMSNNEGMANAHEGLGRIAMLEGDLQAAETFYNTAYDLLREIGDAPVGMCSVLKSLGELHHKAGDFELADDALMAAVDYAEASGSRELLADTLYEAGVIYLDSGAFERAEKAHGRSLLLNQELNRQRMVARQCWALGDVYKAREDFDRALVLGRQAEKLFRGLGDMESALSVTSWIGGIRATAGI